MTGSSGRTGYSTRRSATATWRLPKKTERFLVLDASKPLEEVIEEFYERFWLVEVGR